MSVTLCVSLWPIAGHEAELVAYEDKVLALLGDHGGRVVARARKAAPEEPDQGAFETQLISFDTADGVETYLADPRRTALSAVRDTAIGRTEMHRVTLC